MQAIRVAVKGLFSTFDHDITFKQTDPVTIIHGPNGHGKTVLLRMISAVADGQFELFRSVPFGHFSLWFGDGRRLEIRPVSPKSDKPRHLPELTIELVAANGERTKLSEELPSTAINKQVLDEIDRSVPSPWTRFLQGWRNNHTSEHLSLYEIIARFPSILEQPPLVSIVESHPNCVFYIRRKLKTYFIQTQRLESVPVARTSPLDSFYYPGTFDSAETPRLRTTVEEYSADLAQKLESVLADYANHSQQKDRSFPERLVKFLRESVPSLTAEVILTRLRELDRRRTRLVDIGVLESEESLKDLTAEDVTRAREALTIYVEDVADKLNVFNDMAARVGTLLEVINKRFRYKRLTVTRRGLGLRPTRKGMARPRLIDLSSGEQNELVVLYALLFRVPENGLVLIDEPEISLHVAWQAEFLEDLIKILRVTNAKAVIATHSPMIIGKRWDLAVELSGPPEDAPAAVR